eukprot:3939508-Rhodomonas_salina.4
MERSTQGGKGREKASNREGGREADWWLGNSMTCPSSQTDAVHRLLRCARPQGFEQQHIQSLPRPFTFLRAEMPDSSLQTS